MLENSPGRIGETIAVAIAYDAADRSIRPHPRWVKALKANTAAKKTFDQLPPSRQKEIVRNIAGLKTEESIDRNIQRAIAFLNGNGRFAGRDKP